MDFEIRKALTLIDEKVDPFLVAEALADDVVCADITQKRRARQILADLSKSDATARLILRIKLY